jgi:hypothetical protein
MRVSQQGQRGCSTGESANIVGVICEVVMAAPYRRWSRIEV